MSVFTLKIIAIISMFLDHFSYLNIIQSNYLNYIGRLAFPIFAFLISEGYSHTKNLKKYFIRLIIFAIISQIPFSLFLHIANQPFSLNTLFTLSLGLLCIYSYNKHKEFLDKNDLPKFLCIIPPILIISIGAIIKMDYGYFGICLVFFFYIFKRNKLLMNIFSSLLILIFYFDMYYGTSIIVYFPSLVSTLFSLFIVNCYNGKKGKNIKYLFYLFYPLHLTLIYIISLLIN